jgi:hypothetical protein
MVVDRMAALGTPRSIVAMGAPAGMNLTQPERTQGYLVDLSVIARYPTARLQRHPAGQLRCLVVECRGAEFQEALVVACQAVVVV